MAEDIVGGLFGINPAMYQQQQQQQVLKNAIAMQQLDPFQRAGVGLQQAGYNFAGALGGALGGVDPQLQRISTLNAISKQIDQSNPESMMNGAKMLADAGFTQEALGLANYARKANSELALAEQRRKEGRAAAIPKEVQIAEYAANLRVVLGELESGPQTADTPRQIALLKARLEGLPQPKEAAQNPDIVKAQRVAQIVDQLAIIKGLPEEQQSPQAIRALETELAILNPQKDAAVSANIQESLEIGRLVGKIAELDQLPLDLQDPVRKKQLEAQLESLTKNTKQSEFAQILQDAGYIPGSEDYKTKMKEFANLKLTEKLADKPNIKEIGVSATGDAVYLDVNKDEQFTFKIENGKTVRQPYAGRVDRTTAKVSATANAPAAKQEEAFSVQRGKDQAAALADASASARAASQAITSITTMKQLDQTGQLVTGPLANSYVGASNLLASIGLLSKNQVSILTSSQVYDKSAKDLVMQDLNGKLGAQISDADRKFVEDRIPQLTTSAKARTELLDKIEQIQRGKIAYYGKMKAHANKNRNLDDFDFSEVYTVTPPVGSQAATEAKRKADAIIKGEK